MWSFLMHRHTLLIAYFIYCLSFVYNFFSTGNKKPELVRERENLEKDIFRPLGKYMFRRAYRMKKASFYKLHSILKPHLDECFFPNQGGKRDPKNHKYLISTEIRLSIALRYFAGGCPYDILLTHGVSYKSVFVSVWGVVDAVNKCKELEFSFPNHEEQQKIAAGFKKKSGANFSNVIGAIDGILIWMMKPSFRWCRLTKCGEGQYKCHRKDKFGMNIQAIYDHKLRFTWIDIRWPGSTSDYLAWVTSDLCQELDANEVTKKLAKDMTLVGDNAYIKKRYMAVPLKGQQIGYPDAYNFYVSQLRITIERAFGALVHRWSILRGPLLIPLPKVAPTIMCLCRLHNFCINCNEIKIEKMTVKSALNIQNNINFNNFVGGNNTNEKPVTISENGCPIDLLNGGHHFHGAPQRIKDKACPMDDMLKEVIKQNLQRPTVRERRKK